VAALQSLFTTHRTLTGRILGLLVFVYVLMVAPSQLLPGWFLECVELSGFVLLTVAAFGRVWCLMFIAGKKSQELTKDGPYSVVRNPLYVFSFLGAIGLGLAVESLILAVAFAIFFAVTYPIAVAHEEADLLSLFGPTYAGYCETTPRWIPDWRLYKQPQTLVVSPVKVLHGMVDAMWFLWVFLAWEIIELLRETGVLRTWF
jgi:protein-S-isoprenylcysteine O-methyltransferase Ste14